MLLLQCGGTNARSAPWPVVRHTLFAPTRRKHVPLNRKKTGCSPLAAAAPLLSYQKIHQHTHNACTAAGPAK